MRTLYERANNIILEPENQKNVIVHVNKALTVCGYSNWSFKELGERMDSRNMKQQQEERRKKQKDKGDGQKKIMVTIPYMRGVSEAVERTLRRYGIATAVRPYKTLRQLLAHQKDKMSVQE